MRSNQSLWKQAAKELLNMDVDNWCDIKEWIWIICSVLFMLSGRRCKKWKTEVVLSNKTFKLQRKKVYTLAPASPGPLKRWTVQGTADYLGLDHEIYISPETRICAANMILLDLKNQTIYDTFIKPWMTCARVKECIAPEGEKKI